MEIEGLPGSWVTARVENRQVVKGTYPHEEIQVAFTVKTRLETKHFRMIFAEELDANK